MRKIGFAKQAGDVDFVDSVRQKYAYVVYDLNHQRNMEQIRSFYQKENATLHGRFGNFEYWNMDRVLRESLELAQQISKK